MPVGDSTLSQVIRRHFDADPVAGSDTDEVPAHLSRYVRKYLVPAGQLDPVHGRRQNFRYHALYLDQIFFLARCHMLTFLGPPPSAATCTYFGDAHIRLFRPFMGRKK